jgi:hypothetical protein
MTDNQPATPTTAPEAAALLTQRSADPVWGQRLMAHDVATVKEFNDLTRLVASANTATEVLAGKLSTPSTADARLLGAGIEQLRSAGIGDDVIASFVSGQLVSQKEHDAVSRLMKMKQADQGWTEKLLKGDSDTKREFTLMSIVLASEIKREEAA